MTGKKKYETRSSNMLRSLIGHRVMLAETGNGKPLVRCSARISEVVECFTQEAYESYRRFHAVPVGSEYDWKPGTKKKVLYRLDNVIREPEPFHPAEGKRHGRTWMEYNGREDD